MKLKRIDAVSYGLLKDCSLGDLGDGLTVVLGPNESGKSTFRNLVRHVFYGFPDKRSVEPGYRPPDSSPRSGRLVLEDGTARYVLTRSGDTRGGDVRVEAAAGPERPNLLDELVGRVSEHTYKVVFCFGLDELSAIETGSDQDVVSRLFAGVSGLGVNPMDVRSQLEAGASEIFKPKGRSGGLHDTLSAIKAQRDSIGVLEAQARDYSADQQRLRDLAERLALLQADRDAAERAVRLLTKDLERARSLDAAIQETVEACEAAQLRGEEAEREAKRNKVNEQLLAIEPDVSVLLEEASGAKQKAKSAAELEKRAAEDRRKAEAMDVPAGVRHGAAEKVALENWRNRKAKLEAEAEAAERSAKDSEAEAASLEGVLDTAASAAGQPSAMPAVGWSLLALGVVALALGVILGQYLAAGVGGAVLVAGLVVLLAGRRGPSSSSLGDELLRARAKAERDRLLASDASERLVAATSEWHKLLAEYGLDGRGHEIPAVEALIEKARKRDELLEQAASREAQAAGDGQAAEAWRAALTALVRGPLGISESHPEPQALAIRAREALASAREIRDAHDAAIRQSEAARGEYETGMKKLERLRAEIGEIAATHGIEGSPVSELEIAEVQADEALVQANEALQLVASEHDELKGVLKNQGLDASMALARQNVEGLLSTAQAQADAYLIDALAVALIDKARERYERDRQPEVVRTAAGIFESMTDGRYTRLNVPMDKAAIQVVSKADDVRLTSQLSKGTVEQLYLALRVGLIKSFGELAPDLPVLMDDIVVNYDETRVHGAVAAVAALASERQVVFFTCHENTADALVAGVSGASLIRLDRCALGGGVSG